MQNIIFIIREPIVSYDTSVKIGNQYINRIAIDEEEAFEIIKIIKLPKLQSLGSVLFLFSNYVFSYVTI